MESHLVKTYIPKEDYEYFYNAARTSRLTVAEVLTKAIAIGLYAMRRDDDRKSLFIHNGKSFQRINLGDINLSKETEDES